MRVALARNVDRLPRGSGLAYEPKFDGHRLVVLRYPGGKVLLQARSGRIVTASFPDLAEAARRLPAGTVLDGEVVVWHEGRTDFAAVQTRAMATPARAPALARRLPASYAAFDLLAEEGADLRARSYELRRERLVAVLAPLGPPLQPVPMTTDPDEAASWYETLPAAGVEGLVVKRLDHPYRGGVRQWEKLRHTDTHDAVVVGFTGTARRPSALVVVVPDDDTPVLSNPLTPELRVRAAKALDEALGDREPEEAEETVAAAGVGEVPYLRLPPDVSAGLTAEVSRGTTRLHRLITVLRLRTAE
ncbi:ATP-dependent DNA ligase [Streptomyces tritici]|uniref:ATP-dependent DNA ligase n=1 Tax=Streptomyces tritici TaxID=2054410 RepID=UPI003AEF5FDB